MVQSQRHPKLQDWSQHESLNLRRRPAPAAVPAPDAGPAPRQRPAPTRRPAPDVANPDMDKDRHKCPACKTLFKLYNGTRTCPCNHDGIDKELRVDYQNSQMFVYDLDTHTVMGEVKYARGFTEHPDYFTVPQMAATVHAVRNTGVLMSPSEASSSEDEHTADYPDDDRPVHGFSPPTTDSEEEAVPRRLRKSTTREDFLDEDDHEGQQGATRAPPGIPTTTPPTDAAPEAMPSEEEGSGEDGPSPKKTRSGKTRDQMPYKPRRYKGRRSR